ncbi:hypothetical protein YC2023_012104 [Brassica napus]
MTMISDLPGDLIMLWNPFTGQTSWGIQQFCTSHTYALGSYQESRYRNCSYKILSYKSRAVSN